MITAAAGRRRYRCIGSHPEIDLLITDILMPGMDGRYARCGVAIGLNPDLAVVLMSGNCDAKQIDNDFTFVSKPFSFIDLLGKIKSLTRSRLRRGVTDRGAPIASKATPRNGPWSFSAASRSA